MADDTYIIDQLATGTATVTLTDDGSGIDWLVLDGTYADRSDIRLSWVFENGASTAASGLYWPFPTTGRRLVINGLIENVRGGDGEDFIQGNELGNRLEGDKTDAGAADILWGLDGDDIILGGGGNDQISGDAGNDRLFGGTGDDSLSGGSGADYIEGGAGADHMTGGSEAGDTVSYRGSDAGVTVALTFGAATVGTGGHAEGDSIAGFRNIDGSDLGDRLTDTVADRIAFGGNDNVFCGFDGRDTLFLGGGNDRGFGGDGHDTIWGGAGRDRGYGGAGNDTLNLGRGNDLGRGGGGNDVLRGEEGNDRLYGGGGDDILFPGEGNDVARGGGGNDQILTTGAGRNTGYGGSGDDKMIAAGGINTFWGGKGADRFEFRATAANLSEGGRTTIHDFQRAKGEVVDLRAMGQLDFIGTQAFGGTQAQVRYETTTAGVRVFADIDGDGSADLRIDIDGLARVFASDFLLA